MAMFQYSTDALKKHHLRNKLVRLNMRYACQWTINSFSSNPTFHGFFAVLGIGVPARLLLELMMHRIQICGVEPIRQAPLDAKARMAAAVSGFWSLDLIGMDKM